MRNPSRLIKLYNKLKTNHEKVPDLRFTQLMIAFFEWRKNTYGSDGFYVEDDEFVVRFKKFMRDLLND